MKNPSETQKRIIDSYRRQAKGYDASGIKGLESWYLTSGTQRY